MTTKNRRLGRRRFGFRDVTAVMDRSHMGFKSPSSVRLLFAPSPPIDLLCWPSNAIPAFSPDAGFRRKPPGLIVCKVRRSELRANSLLEYCLPRWSDIIVVVGGGGGIAV
ncbi:hypothetical protein H6P81_016566 [Aristolochia fimbriata]|uniref:Uncharacterized protein n=1 Tax=Aristolochia fimbriata TaxID=158543 RepID=A0AAV7EBL4_ARIFI|nr:hypothetical protein H6P81_016566 [Aristolochia fimbriata]